MTPSKYPAQRLMQVLLAPVVSEKSTFVADKNEQVVFRDDQTYPFRVEPYFKAWVPLTQAPGSFLRLVPGQRPMLVYKQVAAAVHRSEIPGKRRWT